MEVDNMEMALIVIVLVDEGRGVVVNCDGTSHTQKNVKMIEFPT